MVHIGKVNGLTSLCEFIYLNSTTATQDDGDYYYAGNFCLSLSTWKHCCILHLLKYWIECWMKCRNIKNLQIDMLHDKGKKPDKGNAHGMIR